MVPVRSLNEQWMYLGVPGTGKSWKAREDLWEAARETGGYVIAHDPTDSFEDAGVKIPHLRYSGVYELTNGIRQHGGSCVHILDTNNGDDVLTTAKSLAAQSMANAHRKEQEGMFSPVYVYWDEAVAAGDVHANYLSPLWMDALARRRRYGIAPVMTSQSATFQHKSVLMLASKVYAFRLPDPNCAQRLRSVGLSRELGEYLPRVPDRQFFEIVKGQVTHVPEGPFLAPPRIGL